MTRNDKIRKEIIFQLYAVRPVPLSAGSLARDARQNHYDFSEAEVKRELAFLSDRGLIVMIEEKLSAEILYRITADGVTEYERNYAS